MVGENSRDREVTPFAARGEEMDAEGVESLLEAGNTLGFGPEDLLKLGDAQDRESFKQSFIEICIPALEKKIDEMFGGSDEKFKVLSKEEKVRLALALFSGDEVDNFIEQKIPNPEPEKNSEWMKKNPPLNR